MANITDKITDTRNAARPVSARVTVARSIGGTTLTCNGLTGWPTASKVHFVTYQIDTNSDPVAGTQLDCSGIVSGSTITQLSVLDGTDAGNSVGDVVEMLPTASWGQDLADALSVGHTRTGAHAASLPLTTPVLTTPTITDFTAATHTHATNAQGGQLTGSTAITAGTVSYANLLTTIFSGQMSTQANAGSAGGNLWWVNLGGIKILWATGSNQAIGGAGQTGMTYTLPAFFTTISTVIPGIHASSGNSVYVYGASASTSSISIDVFTAGAMNVTSSIFVIGT